MPVASPKSTKDYPQPLQPFIHHKLDLTVVGTSDAQGTCPFCSKEKKFFVSQVKGMYDCKSCGERGNVYTFVRKLHGDSTCSDAELAVVAKDRRVSVATLKKWGLTKSLVDGEWILPAYGPKGEINNLYRWVGMTQKDGSYKRRLLTTATLPHCLFGTQFWGEDKDKVYILEGPWDAMALWQVTRQHKLDDGVVLPCKDLALSIYSEFNIVAVPGCETFREEWVSRFKGKHIYLSYDNDHPRRNRQTGKMIAPAGYTGMQATAKKLRGVAASIQIINWGEEGWDKDREDGFDTRDLLS